MTAANDRGVRDLASAASITLVLPTRWLDVLPDQEEIRSLALRLISLDG